MPPRDALRAPFTPEPSFNGLTAPDGLTWRDHVETDTSHAGQFREHAAAEEIRAEALRPVDEVQSLIHQQNAERLTDDGRRHEETMRMAAAKSFTYYQETKDKLRFSAPDSSEAAALADVVDPPLLNLIADDEWIPNTPVHTAVELADLTDLGRSPLGQASHQLNELNSQLKMVAAQADIPPYANSPLKGLMAEAEYEDQVRAELAKDDAVIGQIVNNVGMILNQHPELSVVVDRTVAEYEEGIAKSIKTSRASHEAATTAAATVAGHSHPGALSMDKAVMAGHRNAAIDTRKTAVEHAAHVPRNRNAAITYVDALKHLPTVGVERRVNRLAEDARELNAEHIVTGSEKSEHAAYAATVALRHEVFALRDRLRNTPNLTDEGRLFLGECIQHAQAEYQRVEALRARAKIESRDTSDPNQVEYDNQTPLQYIRNEDGVMDGAILHRDEDGEPIAIYQDGACRDGVRGPHGIEWGRLYSAEDEEIPLPVRRNLPPNVLSPVDISGNRLPANYEGFDNVPAGIESDDYRAFFANPHVYLDEIYGRAEAAIARIVTNERSRPIHRDERAARVGRDTTEVAYDILNQTRINLDHALRNIDQCDPVNRDDVREALLATRHALDYQVYRQVHDRGQGPTDTHPTGIAPRVALMPSGALRVMRQPNNPDSSYILMPDGSAHMPDGRVIPAEEEIPMYIPPPPSAPPTPPTPPVAPVAPPTPPVGPTPPVTPPAPGAGAPPAPGASPNVLPPAGSGRPPRRRII